LDDFCKKHNISTRNFEISRNDEIESTDKENDFNQFLSSKNSLFKKKINLNSNSDIMEEKEIMIISEEEELKNDVSNELEEELKKIKNLVYSFSENDMDDESEEIEELLEKGDSAKSSLKSYKSSVKNTKIRKRIWILKCI
jgi:hypothetical protein